MPVETPELIWLMGQEVLDCVCEALTEQSSCGCPCRTFMTMGNPVWDNCCDGQMALVLDRLYVQSVFPQADAGTITCAAPLVGEFTLQLIRCVPVQADDGSPPTAQALNDSSASIYADMYIAYRAIICCLAAYKKARLFTMRDARNVGPQGGCAGFEIKFSIQIMDPIPVI